VSGDFLLDTNIVVALFASDDAVIGNAETADSVFVSSTVVGELFFGAYNSVRLDENVERVALFVATNAVLSCDADTARLYGRLKTKLRVKGRPIPENDLWIAAIAEQYSLTLVSRDAHFNDIEDLVVVAW